MGLLLRRRIIAIPIALLGLAGPALAAPGIFYHTAPSVRAQAAPSVFYHSAQFSSAPGILYHAAQSSSAPAIYYHSAQLSSAPGMLYHGTLLAFAPGMLYHATPLAVNLRLSGRPGHSQCGARDDVPRVVARPLSARMIRR
jgi:hypothetical protein